MSRPIASLFMFALVGIAASAAAQTPRPTQLFETSAGQVKITPVYHAGVLVQADGKTIYFDPTKPGDYTGLPPADLIFITHEHGDHMDPAEISAISNAKTSVIGPAAVAAKIGGAATMANGEKKSFGGMTIEAVPAYNVEHKRPTGEPYHPMGVGNGYILNYGGKRFYFSGDTEGVPEVTGLKNIDVAFVCMNLPFTMDVAQAVAAVKALHPKIVYPYHYRGFKDSDLQAFKAGLAGSGVEVRLVDWYVADPSATTPPSPAARPQ